VTITVSDSLASLTRGYNRAAEITYGYEVARHLRSDAQMENVILIALTGYGQSEDRKRSHQAGFDHHPGKPVDPDVLQTLSASHQPSGAEKSPRTWRDISLEGA